MAASRSAVKPTAALLGDDGGDGDAERDMRRAGASVGVEPTTDDAVEARLDRVPDEVRRRLDDAQLAGDEASGRACFRLPSFEVVWSRASATLARRAATSAACAAYGSLLG